MLFRNGNQYEGHWDDGKMDNRDVAQPSVMTFADKSIYTGNYRKNKRWGQAKFISAK